MFIDKKKYNKALKPKHGEKSTVFEWQFEDIVYIFKDVSISFLVTIYVNIKIKYLT